MAQSIESVEQQFVGELQQKREAIKVFTSKQIESLIQEAASKFVPDATVVIHASIENPHLVISGEITTKTPDVTIKIDSLDFENDTDGKSKLHLTKPAAYTEEVREKNLLELGKYKALKGIVLASLSNPQQLLAMGMQARLDGLKAEMKVKEVGARVQKNNAVAIKVVGEPKR